MAMARAQELQEWDGKFKSTWWPHMLQMAGLHVQQLLFYPPDWDLAFYNIL
jgi:hypothetical protein